MKRFTLKRIISLLLAIGMIFTMLPSMVVTAEASGGVKQALDAFMSQKEYQPGNTWKEVFDGGIECYGFAKLVVNTIFGQYSSNKCRSWDPWDKSTSLSGVDRLGILYNGEYSSSNVKKLLSNAKPGYILQVGPSRQHSMIIYEIKDNSVMVYDCNSVKDTCNIALRELSYGNWVGRNSDHMALLRSENYDEIDGTTQLPAPTISVGNVASTGKPRVTWDAVPSAAKYEVYRAESSNGTYTKISTPTGTAVTNTKAVVGETYWYKVRAIASDGTPGVFSAVKKRTCDLPMVTNVRCENITSSGGIKITWDAVEGADYYGLFRSTSPEEGTYQRWDKELTKLSYSNLNQTVPGTTYYYKVKAFVNDNDAATSAASEYASATRKCAQPVLEADTSNDAVTGKPQLTWAAIDGAQKYRVGRANSANGTYNFLEYAEGTAWTDTTAVPGETYYYKIRAAAETSAGNSVMSAYVERTCSLAVPTNVTCTNLATTGALRVQWDAVDGADYYQLFRATSVDGEYMQHGDELITDTYYVDTNGMAEGATYYYKVKALMADKEIANSAYSEVVSDAHSSYAQAQWGLAVGENSDQVPENSDWIGSGTLLDAVAYANACPAGTVYIQLLDDVNTSAPLVFTEGMSTVLDLNGKTIDRGLQEATPDGNVITVEGALTLCDTSANASGKITGGYDDFLSGGGVDVRGGTFTMKSGTISGNAAAQFGAGVNVESGNFTMSGGAISGNDALWGSGVRVSIGTFIMTGGTISENTSENTVAGVYMGSGTMNISGTPVIAGNTMNGTASNVYLDNDISLTVIGALTDSASIGIANNLPEDEAPLIIATSEDYNLTERDVEKFSSDKNHLIALKDNALFLEKRPPATVSIEGIGEYGQTLTAHYVGGDAVTYQWYRDDIAIIGATQKTYTLVFDDIGKIIKVVAVDSNEYFDDAIDALSEVVVKSTPTYIVPTDLTAFLGQTLSDITLPLADNGSWRWKDASISVGEEGEKPFALVFTPTDPGYESVEFVVTVTVKNVPNALWCAPVADQQYTGKALKPEIEIYYRDTLLILNKDYTISYKNNTNAAASDASDAKGRDIAPQIIIKGKGNYAGTVVKNFTILPISLDDPQISALDMAALYNGKVQNPKVTVSYGTKKLGTKDFVVSYPDTDTTNGTPYLDAGIWTIQLDGTGNYTGTRYVNFTITSGQLMSKATIGKFAAYEYTGVAIEPEVTVSMGKMPLVEGIDYAVEYLNNIEVGTATVVITGMGNYAGTKTATFKINGLAISKVQANDIPKSMTYTGDEVSLDGYSLFDKATRKFLEEGTHYTVDYDKNTNKGTATVIFTGINNYTGTLKKTFKIDAYDILKNIDGRIEVEENLVASYMKGGAKPDLVITFNGETLVAGVDYTLAYKNNTAVADADSAKPPMITITGKGNFAGKLTVNFSVEAKKLSEVELIVDDKPYTPKATGLPTVTLTDADGKKLAAGKDYEKAIIYTYTTDVTLGDGTKRNAGDTVDKKDIIPVNTVICVTVTGIGAYTGEATATYRVVPQSLAKATVKVANQQYTGKPIIPDKSDITVTVNKVNIDPDNFEIVSCTNNVNKGSATLTIRGVGENYGGVKTVKFKIDAKTMFWYEVKTSLFGMFT